MTIQEAIRSGKPFRRYENSEWNEVSRLDATIEATAALFIGEMVVTLFASDICADDWEVKE